MSPELDDRLAALARRGRVTRSSGALRQPRKRKPIASRVVAAGVSTSGFVGLVAAMAAVPPSWSVDEAGGAIAVPLTPVPAPSSAASTSVSDAIEVGLAPPLLGPPTSRLAATTVPPASVVDAIPTTTPPPSAPAAVGTTPGVAVPDPTTPPSIDTVPVTTESLPSEDAPPPPPPTEPPPTFATTAPPPPPTAAPPPPPPPTTTTLPECVGSSC